jgi:hypothetical protein
MELTLSEVLTWTRSPARSPNKINSLEQILKSSEIAMSASAFLPLPIVGCYRVS